MCTSEAFIGKTDVNPFHFSKNDLAEVTIYRNGFPTAGTPISTEDDKRLYFNSMGALAYVENDMEYPCLNFKITT